MSSETTNTHDEGAGHEEHETMSKGRIWKVFFILLAITCFEFFIALLVAPYLVNHHITTSFINPVYIILTLLKAYFIVAFFMHLKFENTGLALAIIIPILFIIGLILVLTNESHHWIDLRS